MRGCSQSIATQEAASSPGIKRTQQDAGILASDCRRKSSFRSATSPALGSLVAWSKSAPRPASAGPQQCRPHPAASFQRCISSYYHHFHPSHPLVLPQKHLLPRVKEEALQPLLAVMHWVGSKYIAPETDQLLLLDMARLSVDEAQTKRANGFTVQAMTVLLVALDGTGYAQQAVELLTRTKQMALSLGMNYSQFMTESKTRFRVLDESWRRTWWELYVLDGMFAGAHRATTFSLLDVPTDVGLPCEDDDYETDQIPEPCTLQDLSDRDLSIERCDFSSFSYRVLSVQNLGKVIQNHEAAEVDANVHAQLEVLLSSWRHNLPASKRDSLQRDGRPDEMMFQAHMLNHTTSILLHRSRAQLDLGPTQAIDACAPPRRACCRRAPSSRQPARAPRRRGRQRDWQAHDAPHAADAAHALFHMRRRAGVDCAARRVVRRRRRRHSRAGASVYWRAAANVVGLGPGDQGARPGQGGGWACALCEDAEPTDGAVSGGCDGGGHDEHVCSGYFGVG
ncbi:N-terminal binuclear Zn cluster-containing/DNA binding domain-containing protein [Beauveria brongniartii RCEF 3172]|uniref:N-terminal binuclear Zn cluster-containing/DNA binding domain-containing protein n=1 Tax=Beauveria brongniartii RCEF 3172 TaxID=1081107 RepID=A0A166XB52_9HYPO|nr:N-terminal binuclear Zn cluster-containing/DNA binding domain-containing protein [Beauveria brongniartii RCEF 3172]